MKNDQFDQVVELLKNIHNELRVSNVPDHLKSYQRLMLQEEEMLYSCEALIQDYEYELDTIADRMLNYTEESFNDLEKVKTIKQRISKYQKWINDANTELVSLQQKGCIGKKVYDL
jgi:chromosome segregation ATPase